MGGCCGGMKTGQKSLPDKKKSSSDVAAQEKSNGKETVPATDAAGKTPTPDAEGQREPIAGSVKASVDAKEPVLGSDNVMDLDTAVAPYEGVVSNADPSQIQAVAAVDSELLLPYQIPVQHTTLGCTTTTTTITTVRQEGVLLRVDEPQVDVDFQGGSALSALVGDLASSTTGDVQVETVTKVTETVTTEAIPAVPELGAGGTVEFGSTGASGETVEEPVVLVVKSSSHEVQRLPEEILPSGGLEGSGLAGEAGVGADVSLPGFNVFSGFENQLSPDPSQVVISGSVPEGEQVMPHAELAIGEPSGLVRDLEQELIETTVIQQQVVADFEAAPESATESSSVPVQDVEVNASLELSLPDQSAGELLSTSSPFEPESSAPELHSQLESEFAATSHQQPEDFPPPLQRDQAVEPPSFEGVADLSVTPSAPEELVRENEVGITGTLQWEQDQASEPAPYLQTEESQSRHQEFEQEPYQEQQQHSEDPASYHAASGVESFEVQDPVSVSDVIQANETRPVVESVSEEAHESRNTWWKEGGQPDPEGEVPVVETVSDQSQQSRQTWWEQTGSEPVLLHHEELPAEPLPPQPDDLPSIPPPPPTSEEGEEQAVSAPPSIPAEIGAVSPSSDTFPEVIPEPLPSTFDQGGGAAVESPLSSSVDGSTLPTENGEVSGSSDEAFTPASVLSPEGSTPGATNLSPDGVEPAAAAASSKEPISTQA